LTGSSAGGRASPGVTSGSTAAAGATSTGVRRAKGYKRFEWAVDTAHYSGVTDSPLTRCER